MPIPVTPEVIPLPFAQNGQKNTIPEQGGATTDPAASWSAGFPPITMINKQAGGKPPYGMDFNGIFNALSQHIFFSQSGCVYPWMGADEETEFAGLNYLKGSHVLGSDGEEYVALKPSGPDVPASAGGFVGPVDPVGENAGEYWKKMGAQEGGGVLAGTIVAFSGSFGGEGNRFPIPANGTEPDLSWCLCDGVTTNGLIVPDLRGRMILGASDAYPAGSTGGSAAHDHSLYGATGYTTLTVAEMPTHAHNFSIKVKQAGVAGIGILYQTTDTTWNNSIFSTENTGMSQGHLHSLALTSSATSSFSPYYALSYIMKVA